MARPLRIQFPGALYYITQHSNAGNLIFKSDRDRETFLKILTHSLSTYALVLHGFVLMKDHFHLLVETPQGNLSEFMRHLNISYTSYFNRLHRRKGHLYGGRYKSILLEKDPYLDLVSHYLHLNPIKTGAIKRKNKDAALEYLSTWKWSSLPGYMGTYPRHHMVSYVTILKSYGGDTPAGRSAYGEALLHKFSNGLPLKPLIVGQAILGSLPFIKEIREMVAPTASSREVPDIAKIDCFLKQEKILGELEKYLKCTRQQLLNTPGDLRAMTMDLLYRYAGLTNAAIGDLMGLDYSSISLGRKKLRQKRTETPLTNAKITLVEKRLERLRY